MSTAPTELPVPSPELVGAVSAYVSAPANRKAFVTECVAEALEMLTELELQRQPPPRLLKRVQVELSAELFHRQKAVAGVMTFDNGAEAPLETVRIAGDPLRRVLPLLARYMGPVVA